MAQDEAPLRVAVSGARGRVGREVVAALEATPGYSCVAAAGRGDDLARLLGEGRAQCLVDFTTPEAALDNALTAVAAGVAPVVGSSGLDAAAVASLRAACREGGLGGCVVANFALGAALLDWLCALAAPFFESCEVVEAHHPGKADAPSGTALGTVEGMLRARGGRRFRHPGAAVTTLPGTRGGELGGVAVHSLRLEGVVAEQEVSFGADGQTLTLGQRTISRAAFVPGVLLACRAVVAGPGFHDGLAELIGLPGPARGDLAPGRVAAPGPDIGSVWTGDDAPR